MATERELGLIRAMAALLSGDPDAAVPEDRSVYAWRLIRWEADVPLTDDQREALLEGVEQTMYAAGAAAALFAATETISLSYAGEQPAWLFRRAAALASRRRSIFVIRSSCVISQPRWISSSV